LAWFVIILGTAILLWSLWTGEIAVHGGGVSRSENPVLFWCAFALCGVLVVGFCYLKLTVDNF
jgi:hypothetical protein